MSQTPLPAGNPILAHVNPAKNRVVVMYEEPYSCLEIPLDELTDHLQLSGKLSWTFDSVNESGEHVQSVGNYDVDEYYEFIASASELAQDCHDFLKQRRQHAAHV